MGKRTTHEDQLAFDLRTKRCPRCEQELPGWDFVQDKGRKSGLAPYCLVCFRAKMAEAYAKNKDTWSVRNGAWRRANRPQVAAIRRRYYWAHLEVQREQNRRFMKRQRELRPELGREQAQRRRALKAAAATAYFTAAQLAERWAYYGDRCWICSAPAAASDHVKPLSKGGAHMLCNLRPICKSCNSRKSAQWPFDPESIRGTSVL